MSRIQPGFLVLVLALVQLAGCALGPKHYATAPLPAERAVAPGRFEPTWDSLVAGYECPEWFRDAKLGFWAHWGPQCVPEAGDWYARSMYIQGHRQYEAHIENYGHPTTFGFMEIDNLWRAENWNPEELIDLYIDAGAKYFVAMANHEDNFDAYDSKYHAWNSLNVGPHQDIIGTWARVAREHGLPFGVSNHSSHAWHWFQTAYGYDAEGPLAGARYDAATLTKADGVGKWWEGLDPRDLYCKPSIVIPDGFTSASLAHQWHDDNNLPWTEDPPPNDPEFASKWFFRCQDLIDKYDPDFLYLDNGQLPLGQVGLDLAAHFYNANIARRGGRLEAVLTSKGLPAERRPAMVQDWERSFSRTIQPLPFQSDTCIGQWHYWKDYDYKTVGQVVRQLVDVVSKNGNLLLSIPLRGDGTIDERERAFLKEMAAWIKVNGEGIYGTRPWHVFGEGPTEVPRGRRGDAPIAYTQEDIRFTTKDGALYAFVLALPTAPITIESLGLDAEFGRPIAEVTLLGSDERIVWRQSREMLTIERPAKFTSENGIAFRLEFR
jgi:alpha-L-fucosidase